MITESARVEELPLVLPLRPPDFWNPTFIATFVCLLLNAAIPAASLALLRSRGIESEGLLWLFFADLALLVLSPLLWFWLRPRTAPPIEVTPDEIHLPRSDLLRRSMRVPITRVFSAHLLGRGKRRWVMLGVANRLPSRIRASAFTEEDGPEKLIRAVHTALSEQPGGTEYAAAFRRRGTVAERARSGVPWVSQLAAASLVLVYVAELVLGAPASPLRLLEMGAISGPLVQDGEWHRLVTGNLLHGPWWHIGINASALIILGWLIERLIGGWLLALILLASGIAGATASALLGEHVVAVGASTGIAGLLGGFVWLRLRYRDDLPPALMLPGWWWLLVLVPIALASELLIPNVDSFGHAGGAVAGLAIMALASARRELLDLHRAPGLRVAVVALAGVYLVAGYQAFRAGVLYGETYPERSPELVQLLGRDPYWSNNFGWTIAVDPDASSESLETANQLLERANELAPEDVAFGDTYATLRWRLGDVDDAIRIQREVVLGENDRFRISQLARFEWARWKREGGPLLVGANPIPEARVHLDAATNREQGPSALVVTLPENYQGALELHAIATRGDELIGHLRFFRGETAPHSVRLTGESRTHHPFGDDEVELHVVLIDTDVSYLEADQTWWYLWVMDPEVAALP